jgi:hypothetical protein
MKIAVTFRHLYLKAALAEPGGMTWRGENLELSRASRPPSTIYLRSCRELMADVCGMGHHEAPEGSEANASDEIGAPSPRYGCSFPGAIARTLKRLEGTQASPIKIGDQEAAE